MDQIRGMTQGSQSVSPSMLLLVRLQICMHYLLSTFYLTILLVSTSRNLVSILTSIGQIRNRELINHMLLSHQLHSSNIEKSTHGIIPKVNLLTSLFNLFNLLGRKFKLPKFRVSFNPLFILGGSNGHNT